MAVAGLEHNTRKPPENSSQRRRGPLYTGVCPPLTLPERLDSAHLEAVLVTKPL